MSEVSAFYLGYPDLLTRAVQARPSPWWLGKRERGFALASLAPELVFKLPLGRRTTVRCFDGRYVVRALGDAQPLGSLPLAQVRPSIAAALSLFARRSAFEAWTLGRQTFMLTLATCRRDELPAPGTIRLTGYLPFLSLTGL